MSDLTNCIILTGVRCSFPHIAEPQRKQADSGEENAKYNADFILLPNDPAWAKTHELILKLATEKWKDQGQAVIAHVNTDRKKRGYAMGSEKVNGTTLKVYEGYEGNFAITASSKKQPQIIAPDGNPIDPANTMACMAEARRIYGGCYVNAVVKPWMQDNKHGKGIRFDLIAIQFHSEGQPFGEGAVDVKGVFGAVASAAAGPGWAPAALGAAPGAFGAPPTPSMPAAPFGTQQPAAFGAPPAAQFGAPAAPPSWGQPATNVPSFLR